MSGSIYLYITTLGKSFKIPKPKEWVFKAILQLADQEVLCVCLMYETRNRKPNFLYDVSYYRFQLDSKGQFIMTQEEFDKRMRNWNEFAYQTPESLCQREGLIQIPDSLVIPTSLEKENLLLFIKSQYPVLLKNSGFVIEQSIISRNETNENHIKLVKEAAKIRGRRKYKG